jgi:transposase
VDLWSLDKCHFQQHGTRCRMWVPPEETDPLLLHAPTRKTVALFGAVQPESGRLVTRFEPRFNATRFGAYLRQLLRHRARGRRLVAVLDNAAYHRARALAPFLAAHRDVLRLLFLPPYSPELNPIERVWKLARRLCTHNRYFPKLDELVEAVTAQMQAWRNPNPVLQRLCGII